jgi:hypothetical protein
MGYPSPLVKDGGLRTFSILTIVLLLNACGGKTLSTQADNGEVDSGASAALAGRVNGTRFDVADLVVVTGPALDLNGNPVALLEIVASSAGSVCSRMKGEELYEHKGETAIRVSVQQPKSNAFTKGTFDIAGEPSEYSSTATARIVTCPYGVANPNGESGSVTITEITDTSVSGALDVTFDDGSSLRGAFAAPRCSVKPSVVTVTACQE